MSKKAIKILVIEDDTTMRDGIQTVLNRAGYTVFTAANGFTGSRLFQDETPHLVIIDLKLPGKNGMELLTQFLEKRPETLIILISAFGNIDLAVNALKLGARDFIPKPFTIYELRQKVSQLLEDHPLQKTTLRNLNDHTFHGIAGTSRETQKLKEKILQVASVDSAVLITGESGTGKELVARAIHKESGRNNNPLLAVNCSALTETLLASELFGHEKGAFTGAVKRHIGYFERASGGTIFLDEIGDISLVMQAKLLRVLQEKSFQRVGGTDEIVSDVRIIAATNKDLGKAIRNSKFREDLFFRLNVLPIHIPPLRERKDDIPDLVEYVTEKKVKKLKLSPVTWTEKAMEKMINYHWPGNVREMENFLERVLIFSHSKTITEKDIYYDLTPDMTTDNTGSLNEILEDTEFRLLVDAMKKTGGVKQRAAKLLGIKTSTLYYKLEKYGLDIKEKGET